jgi:protein involved in polysaccharide export with SLBB domain
MSNVTDKTWRWAHWCALVVLCLSGCVASQAIPVRKLPPSLLAAPRAQKHAIDFSRLAQDPPPHYILGPGDILGVFVEGALGQVDSPPPVHFSQSERIPPSTGFPVQVSEDGTIDLPLLKAPLRIAGLSLLQASKLVRETYVTEQKILAEDKARTVVTLMRKRKFQVLVIREDASTPTTPTNIPTKRGSATAVDLDAFENDVLHALAATGGLPGLDAVNEVVIIHRGFVEESQRAQLVQKLQLPFQNELPPPNSTEIAKLLGVAPAGHHVTRIPLRVDDHEQNVTIDKRDITLSTGDIVFLESRDRDVFYTGGLLPGKEILLPRDYDLDVMAAIAMAGSSVGNGPGTGGSTGAIVQGGSTSMNPRGLIPPTQVIVIRRVNGSQVPIKMSLRTMMTDPRERILIKSGDMILLQYTHTELIGNILLNNVGVNYFFNSSNL